MNIHIKTTLDILQKEGCEVFMLVEEEKNENVPTCP